MDLLSVLFPLIISSSLGNTARAECYFPVEYQGIFSTQSTLNSGGSHKYSQITILPDAIPVWGICHEMLGHRVILHDATGGQECFRCFHVSLHSPNIIQVYTEGLDKCYMNAGAATASCPDMNAIQKRVAREIMLYKSRSFTRDGKIDRVMCPFSGKYHFTYDVNDGTETAIECPDSKSTLSNCPKASELNLRFTQCKFQDMNMGLRCLGDWEGLDGYHYFALWDTGVTSGDQPQYRCAMYHVDEDTGRVFVGFSVDATCTNRLHSPWDGYETMILTPAKPPSPPAPVHAHSCVFPHWANGKWKDIQIRGRELWWKNLERNKFYHMLCLNQNDHNGERYALYSLNQCGVEEFTCIWIKSRDLDVLEFKIATVQYNYFNSSRVCADDVFVGQKWQAQGRMRNSPQVNCPLLGQHTGVIPDAPELCAKLASDCKDSSKMYYTVSSCANSTQVFEKREYKCLGQWKEGGTLYTFTYRMDVNTYECFAGVVINENEVFIMEAGVNCERGLQPLVKGMKLVKKGTCNNSSSGIPESPAETIIPPSRPSLPAWWPSTSRRPWLKKSTTTTQKPLWKNEKPHQTQNSSSQLNSHLVAILISSMWYILSN